MGAPLAQQPGERPKTAGRRWLKRCLLGLALLAGLVATACSQGSYPVDIFYEMHYQQSYRSNEPPSLSPPRQFRGLFPGAQVHRLQYRAAPVRGQLLHVPRRRGQGGWTGGLEA